MKDTTVRVRGDIYIKLDKYCKKYGHSKAWLVSEVLKEYLRGKK